MRIRIDLTMHRHMKQVKTKVKVKSLQAARNRRPEQVAELVPRGLSLGQGEGKGLGVLESSVRRPAELKERAAALARNRELLSDY